MDIDLHELNRLLIELYGIETCNAGHNRQNQTLLIELYGIETYAANSKNENQKTFNRTIWN